MKPDTLPPSHHQETEPAAASPLSSPPPPAPPATLPDSPSAGAPNPRRSKRRPAASKPPSRATARRALQQQLDQHANTVALLLDDVTKQLPALTPDQLHQLGQSFFARLALGEQNVQAWVKIQWLELHRQQFEFAQVKFKEALRSKFQAGLAGVAKAFQENPEALDLYKRACALLPEPPEPLLHETNPDPTPDLASGSSDPD